MECLPWSASPDGTEHLRSKLHAFNAIVDMFTCSGSMRCDSYAYTKEKKKAFSKFVSTATIFHMLFFCV
jgi:hypothetical protein